MVPVPDNEIERLAALRALRIVGTAPDPHFDALCRSAARLFRTPIALVSLMEAEHQWFKARCGLEVEGTAREVAFCRYTILSDDVFVVEDATADARFRDNPLVTGPLGIRFYAGVPLVLDDGIRVGSLCVIDTSPRGFSPAERDALQDLATVVVAQLRLHQANVRQEEEAVARAAEKSALAESEARYRTLAEALPQKVWIARGDGTALFVNAGMRAYHGDNVMTVADRIALQHPRDAERLAAVRAAGLASGTPFEGQARLLRRDGAYRWHKLTMNPIRYDADGSVAEWIGTSLDIDDIIRDQERLMEAKQLLQLAQEAAGAGFFEWCMTDGTARLSRESRRLLGLPEDAPDLVSAEAFSACVDPRDVDRVWSTARDAVARDAPYRTEFRVRLADGRVRWIMAVGRPIPDAESGTQRILGLDIDITERKEAERHAEHMARHDPLTDLPNRVFFRERVDAAVARARETGESVALLCLDLDRFKTVNDTLGHPVGDELLRAIAGRLAGQVRHGDVLARLGGDEFAVLQVGEPQPETARALGQRLVAALSTPVSVGGRDLSVGLSVGVALAPKGETDADTLFKNADLALYRAKREGRSTFRVFDAQMDAAETARQELEIDLREALARGELDLHFQPALDLATGVVTGFEALARWTHPVHGSISPEIFIPLAEETKLISILGDVVLRRACTVAARWPAPTRVAVNVSAVQFEREDLPERVAEALAASGLAPERLELEITETVLMGDSDGVIETLRALRRLGVRIALDDFGTGYSSLGYLRRFAFDRIKIDRSFIRDMEDPDTLAIVRAIVGLGAHLGIAITAEGIETEAQLACVRAEGCSEAQGWLIGRPGPAEVASRRLAGSRAAAA